MHATLDLLEARLLACDRTLEAHGSLALLTPGSQSLIDSMSPQEDRPVLM
jgi:hypothetical protein